MTTQEVLDHKAAIGEAASAAALLSALLGKLGRTAHDDDDAIAAIKAEIKAHHATIKSAIKF